jgi:hypothetical protein
MSMITARYVVNAADSKAVRVNSDPGWRSIGQGLGLVAFGYAALLVGVGLGALLLYWAASGRPVLGRYALDADGLAGLQFLGVVVVGAGGAIGFSVVLVGQWLCLMYAPQGGGAKEWIYVCFTCVLMALALTAAGACLDHDGVYAALSTGPGGWRLLDWHRPGVILLAAGIVLGLVGVLVFTQFLRGLALCFRERARVLGVDLSIWAVGLLLGGSVGAMGVAYRLAPDVNLTPWLVGGWLACFAWQVLVILSVARGLRDNLRRLDRARASRARMAVLGGVGIQSLSGLRRLAQRAAQSQAEKSVEDHWSTRPDNQLPGKPHASLAKADPKKAPKVVPIIVPSQKEK